MTHLDPAERRIIRLVVTDALALHYEVEVGGGPDGAPDCSRSFLELILPAVALGPETWLRFYRAHEREPFGWVRLVHGRGRKVIASSSEDTRTGAILERARDVAAREPSGSAA